jgi:formamidopyrimidine-DNA glycosylase
LPELPEVEAVCRRLRATALGQTIVHVRILRPSVTRPQSPRSVEGKLADATILSIGRRGKHILIELSTGLTLHVHLRMTGNLRVVPDIRLRLASTRAYFEFEDGRGIFFDDPRALGKIHLRTRSEIASALKAVGPEPSEISAHDFVAAAKKTRKPAKMFLMDQRHVSGLGNIYAAEALFLAGIHPARAIHSVSNRRLRRLHEACVKILESAIESADRAYQDPGAFVEGENFPVAVYDREGEPCVVCRRAIRRIPQGGRSTYFCAKCQR